MGLYLAVFDDDEELEGVEVGSYDDFSWFRNTIVDRLEEGVAGSRFPTLIKHSHCDGQWSPSEAVALKVELAAAGVGASDKGDLVLFHRDGTDLNRLLFRRDAVRGKYGCKQNGKYRAKAPSVADY